MPNTGPLEPTAKQTTSFPRVHETPARTLVPSGCGLSAIVHAEPSQPARSVRLAAATHQSGEVQATPLRLLKTPVLGLRSSCQRLPSNDSATVDTTSPLECWPTAMQNDSERQETPARLVKLG